MSKPIAIITLIICLCANAFASGEGSDFHVYPNPIKDKLTVETNGENWSSGVFKLYNIIGDEVASKSFSNTSQFSLILGELQKGLYLYSITNSTGQTYSGRITAK